VPRKRHYDLREFWPWYERQWPTRYGLHATPPPFDLSGGNRKRYMTNEPTRVDAEEARARAAECREEAKRSPKREHKIIMEHVAQTWDRIAKSLEDGRPLERLAMPDIPWE